MRAAILVLALAGCTPSPQPGPTPPVGLPPATVYSELVSAGCLVADDAGAGLLAVVEEHHDGGTMWLECLFDGGTVSSCKVPCQ